MTLSGICEIIGTDYQRLKLFSFKFPYLSSLNKEVRIHGILPLDYFDGSTLTQRSVSGKLAYDFTNAGSKVMGSFHVFGCDKDDKKAIEFLLECFEQFDLKRMTFQQSFPTGLDYSVVAQQIMRLLVEGVKSYSVIQEQDELNKTLELLLKGDLQVLKVRVKDRTSKYEQRQRVVDQMRSHRKN